MAAAACAALGVACIAPPSASLRLSPASVSSASRTVQLPALAARTSPSRAISRRQAVRMMVGEENKSPGMTGNPVPTGARTTNAPLEQGSEVPVGQRMAYVCQDCGYIYKDELPFEEVPDTYNCPVCTAPKARFLLANAAVEDMEESIWGQEGQNKEN
eukprot:SM000158S02008  [mRNA]  locus=s158:116540:117389:+ [translate_table: standard]